MLPRRSRNPLPGSNPPWPEPELPFPVPPQSTQESSHTPKHCLFACTDLSMQVWVIQEGPRFTWGMWEGIFPTCSISSLSALVPLHGQHREVEELPLLWLVDRTCPRARAIYCHYKKLFNTQWRGLGGKYGVLRKELCLLGHIDSWKTYKICLLACLHLCVLHWYYLGFHKLGIKVFILPGTVQDLREL